MTLRRTAVAALGCVLMLTSCKKAPRPGGAASGPTPDASAAKVAKAAPSASQAAVPPSTGKEMPKTDVKLPTQQEARAKVDAALAAAKDGKAECDKVVDASLPMFFDLAKLDDATFKAQEKAMVAVARCAEKKGYYLFLLSIGSQLARAGGPPELLARGLLGLGEDEEADKVLAKAAKARPDDANVRLTMAKSLCKQRKWGDCLKVADEALKLGQPLAEPEKSGVIMRAQKYRARALLRDGKVDDADKAMQAALKLGMDKEDSDELVEQLVMAKNHKVIIDEQHSPEVPLGIYHLYGKVTSGKVPLSLVTLLVDGIDANPRQVRIEVEIPGVTERMVKTATLTKGADAPLQVSPPLKNDFAVGSVRAERSTQINVKVVALDNDKTLYEHSLPVTLLPRDVLPTRRFLDKQQSAMVVTDELFAAWVTPNAKEVDAFLGMAKKRLKNGAAFAGLQAPTYPQVQAVFEELKARGVSYVMDPSVVSRSGSAQRTRLPTEVLTTSNAQCLEGTLLFATLLEAIGIPPVLVRVPGHAFVGWHPHPSEKLPPGQKLFYLETTLTQRASFDEAVKYAFKEIVENEQAKRFRLPVAFSPAARIEIDQLRKAGYTPQPYE